MINNWDCTEKAFDIWNSICYRWNDYDAMSYVTDRAYNIRLEIEHILRFGEGYDRRMNMFKYCYVVLQKSEWDGFTTVFASFTTKKSAEFAIEKMNLEYQDKGYSFKLDIADLYDEGEFES